MIPSLPRPGQRVSSSDWLAICHRNPLLARATGWPCHDPTPPEVLAPCELAQLIATLAHPSYRDCVADILVNILTDRITEIAIAVAQEVAVR